MAKTIFEAQGIFVACLLLNMHGTVPIGQSMLHMCMQFHFRLYVILPLAKYELGKSKTNFLSSLFSISTTVQHR